MNKNISELHHFLRKLPKPDKIYTKSEISSLVVERFSLKKKRSVFYCAEFAIRFSSVRGNSFSNGIVSLSTLQKYDHIPFIVCIVRPKTVLLLLANSTFLKKISHSSQQLRIDNVRGTFLGHDILKEYDGIENKVEHFDELFDIHYQFSWEENLLRLVESTNSIVPTGKRFEPNNHEIFNVLKTPEIAKLLSRNDEYLQIGRDLSKLVDDNLEEIIEAGSIDNLNIRGNRIEQIITSAGNLHSLEDFSRTLSLGHEVKVDIKTKILALSSSPKAYNIDKVLKALSAGNTVFSFFFVGIGLEEKRVVTCLVSILDEKILSATRIQFHWAGRNSRGVTQLSGSLESIFESEFSETINIEKAKEFLQSLIDLKTPKF